MNLPEFEVIVLKLGVRAGRVDLSPGSHLAGSGSACAIKLDDDAISAEHTRFILEAGKVSVENLNSTPETLVEGTKITGLARLASGQVVQIGKFSIEVRLIEEGSTMMAPVAKDVQAAPESSPQQPAAGAPASLTGGRSGKYEVGEKIAAGGMGTILQAQDLAIRRIVAMKVMMGRRDEDVMRFVAEAQITGQLEHPNIVPVHDMGDDHSGQPFYTMKLVRGQTLSAILRGIQNGDAQMIADHPLAHLLTTFQKVCDAVAFAHSKRVIHRDLKPENIMIGDFGEVLVMDWGLAKIIGSKEGAVPSQRSKDGSIVAETTVRTARMDQGETGRTMMGLVVGTPHFMSPEQARGEVDEVDERSDIFSLGAILYKMLTLENPFPGTKILEVLEKVQHAMPTPPVDVTADNKKRLPHLPDGCVPASLSAVVMKALARHPVNRYQTVQELQREIEAYQTGFATRAEKAGLLKQIGLLIQRHKREFSIAFAAAGILLVMTVCFIWNLRASERRAERNADLATRNAEVATKNAEIAKSESLKATKARGQAEDVLEFLVYDMRDELVKVGRIELAEKVRARVDSYFGELGLNPSDKRMLRNRVADLNNHGDLSLSKGDPEASLKSHREALAIAEREAAADPSNSRWQRDLMVTHGRIGDALQMQNKLDDALKSYRDALEINQKLAAKEPANPNWQHDLSVSMGTVGDVLRAKGDLDGALKMYRDALAISEKVGADAAANADWRRDLAVAQSKVGDMLRIRGDLDGALADYEKAVEILQQLSAADPANASRQWDLAETREKIGTVIRDQGKLDDALKIYRQAFAAKQRLAAFDPANKGWMRGLGAIERKLGEVLETHGDPAEALKMFRDMQEITLRLINAEPANPVWQDDLGASYVNIGDVLFDQNQPAAALESYRQSVSLLQKLSNAEPANATWQQELALSMEKTGDALRATGDRKEALRSGSDALALRKKIAAADPSDARAQKNVVMLAMKLASTLEKENAAEAKDFWRQAHEKLSDMKKAGLPLSPDDEKVLEQLRQKAGQ